MPPCPEHFNLASCSTLTWVHILPFYQGVNVRALAHDSCPFKTSRDACPHWHCTTPQHVAPSLLACQQHPLATLPFLHSFSDKIFRLAFSGKYIKGEIHSPCLRQRRTRNRHSQETISSWWQFYDCLAKKWRAKLMCSLFTPMIQTLIYWTVTKQGHQARAPVDIVIQWSIRTSDLTTKAKYFAAAMHYRRGEGLASSMGGDAFTGGWHV